MCWVLDGGLRCASVRAHARVHAMSVCVCVYAHVCVSVHLAACARARDRACVYACLCERMCGFVRFHRIAIPRVCVASGAVRALPSHGGGLRYL